MQLRALVQAGQMLGGGVVQLMLQLADGAALRFLPGQQVRMHWGRSQPRTLAIANAPRRQGNRTIELHLAQPDKPDKLDKPSPSLQSSQASSSTCLPVPPVHAELMLEGPLGDFHWRADCERPVVLLASGLGIVPIKSIVEHVLDERLLRPLHLYWTMPSAPQFYLHAQAQDWAERNDHIYYSPVLATEVCGSDWCGRSGDLLDVLAEDLPDLSGYRIYSCAEAGLLDAWHGRLLGPLRADAMHLHLGSAQPT